jgi:hypothetical protein
VKKRSIIPGKLFYYRFKVTGAYYLIVRAIIQRFLNDRFGSAFDYLLKEKYLVTYIPGLCLADGI